MRQVGVEMGVGLWGNALGIAWILPEHCLGIHRGEHPLIWVDNWSLLNFRLPSEEAKCHNGAIKPSWESGWNV